METGKFLETNLKKEIEITQTEQTKESEFKMIQKDGDDFFISKRERKIPDFFSQEDVEQLQQGNLMQIMGDMEILRSQEDMDRQWVQHDLEYYEAVKEETDDKKAVFARRRQLSDIRTSYQLHTLSATARLERDRLIKNMEWSEEFKEELLNSEKSLDYIVANYVSQEEKKRVAKDTKKHLEAFWALKDALRDDPLMSAKEKGLALYRFAKSFSVDIEIYKSLYLSGLTGTKRERMIDDYIDRFEGLLNYYEGGSNNTILAVLGLRVGSAHLRMFGSENEIVREKAVQKAKKIDKNVQTEEEKEKAVEARLVEEKIGDTDLDQGLTKEQLRGVAAADEWLIGLATSSQKRLPFINRIMSLSARERLFMYRVVEKDHLESPDLFDMSYSQTTYIPNVTMLQYRMFRVPFRLWEKLGNDGLVLHHWEKLETALQLVGSPDVAEAIHAYSKAAVVDKDEKKARRIAKADEPQNIQDILDVNLRQLAEDIQTAINERDTQLEKTIKALEECEKAQKARDSAWFRKTTKADIATQKTNAAIAEFNKLKDIDDVFGDRLKFLYESQYEKENSKADIVKYGMFGAGQASGIIAKLASVPKLFSKDIYIAGMKADLTDTTAMVGAVPLEGLLTGVNVATGAFATAGGVLGLIGGLKSAKTTIKAVWSGSMGDAEAILALVKSGNALISSATGIGLGITSIKYATRVTESMLTGSTEAVKNMKDGVGATKQAMAGIGLAINVADFAVQGMHYYHHSEAEYITEELIARKKLKGDDKEYMKGILKIDERNKQREAAETAFSVVTNFGNLVTASAGPVGSLAWAGISLGVTLTAKLTDYLLQERNKKKSVEEFLQLDDLTDFYSEMDVRAVREIKESKEKMQEFKESLLRHMAAGLGFVTFKSMFKHIVAKYSLFVFQNLFYDSGKAIVDGSQEEHLMSEACVELVKGMGLSVRFPNTSDEKQAEKQRRPSFKSIASKLGG